MPNYQVIVVGAGHAGCEAARACARLGLRTAMMLLYLTFGYVWSVGFWARPLISNATIRGDKATAGM